VDRKYPITDPNPKINKKNKQNNTGMKLKIELYLKVHFLGTGVGNWVYNRLITGTGK